MQITINGEMTDVSNDLTVTALLAELRVEQPTMVSVEVNGTILKRDQHATRVVHAGDAVEFLYFMGGGR